MPVFSTTVVVEQFETSGGMSPIPQGSMVVMAQCGRRWEGGGAEAMQWVVG